MQRKLTAIGKLFVRLTGDESGCESLEYALVGGTVVALSCTAIDAVGERVTAMWQSLDTALSVVVR